MNKFADIEYESWAEVLRHTEAAMKNFHVTYYLCMSGMELGPEREDYGIIQATSADSAKEKVATARFPNPKAYNGNSPNFTDRDWFRGCLTAKEVP